MKVTQMAETLNIVFKEIIGTFTPEDPDAELPLYKEDLSNFVDMGRKIESSTEWGDNYDKYVGKLIDRIGYTLIVDKELTDDGIKIESDRYEYGAFLQKIRIKDIDFVDNEVWNLQAGQSYEYFDFKPVDMEATYFSDKTTFGVEWSWVSKVLKESLTDLAAMTRLYAAIENRIMKKIRLTTKEMKKRLINNVNGCNIKHHRVINLLDEYRTATGDTTTTAATALTNADFLKHTVMRLKMYKKFFNEPTTLMNNEGELNWTPASDFRMVALTDLDAALTAYLYSSTYHDEFVTLDGYATVANWQGVAEGFSFDVRSSINITTTEGTEIAYTGIVATMFDRECITIWNEDPELDTAPYNPKGKFINYYYSYDCNYYYDSYENSLTFVISDFSVLDTIPDDFDVTENKYYVLDGDGGYIGIADGIAAGI
ncbi:MAG: hypothetical protein J6T10_26985, partial [Methanobrevibacter sp.]|nr:hypothetical protein [Methanobrevibacter sp.]